MLKDYLKSQGITITSIQGKSGVPYTTLNDFINGRTDVDSVSVKVLAAVAQSLSKTLDWTYDLCKGYEPEEGRIEIKSKMYTLAYKGKVHKLCKVSDLNAIYVKDIAKTAIENIKRKERMDSWQEKL